MIWAASSGEIYSILRADIVSAMAGVDNLVLKGNESNYGVGSPKFVPTDAGIDIYESIYLPWTATEGVTSIVLDTRVYLEMLRLILLS